MLDSLMRSLRNIWQSICSQENLEQAAFCAARGKTHKPDVACFLERRSRHLPRLRRALLEGAYRPGAYHQFCILEPKPRTISCAPFRDRVVHHAFCSHIGPWLDRRFIPDSYACRNGRGMHAAAERAQFYCRRHGYFLKLDIKSFFPSVDHSLLLEDLHRWFPEPSLRELLSVIVRAPLPGAALGKGMPIGNLSSQWFANAYLDPLDHYLKDHLRVPGYIRYMDDFVLFHDDKSILWDLHQQTASWLLEKRALTLKQRVTRLAPVADGLPFLGLRIFPGLMRIQPPSLRRARRKLRQREAQWRDGELTAEQLADSARAICGRFQRLRIRLPLLGSLGLEAA